MNDRWLRYLPGFLRARLEGRHNLQKIIGNIGWLFVDKVLRMGVGLLVLIWLARYLGPEKFGLFNYAIAFVALFSAIASLGLDGIVVRDIVRNPAAKDEILGTAFMLKLIGGVVALFSTTLVIFLLRPQDSLVHWLVAITAAGLIFQALDTIDFWFQSQVKSKYTVYAKNTAFVIIALVKIVLILQHAPLIAFAWAGLAEVILGGAGLLFAYRINRQHIRRWRANLGRTSLLIRDSWPLIFSGLAIMVYMRIDQIMLGEMLGNQAVGLYSVATQISEVWYFIPMIIVSSVSPSIVEAKKISEDLYYKRIEKLFRVMAAISFSIAIPMTFFSNYVVNILYGSDYSASGVVLAIHIWAAIFVFIGVAQGPWTLSEGLMKLSLQRTIIGAVANVGLNLLLIPKLGIVGAAIATVISQVLSAFLLNAFNKLTRNIFYIQLRAITFWPVNRT